MAVKNDTKNVSITKETQLPAVDQSRLILTDKEKSVIDSTYHKFRAAAQHRNVGWENFDGLSLVQYINESVRRTITNIDAREGIEDWQARVNDKMTQNKVLTILSKVVQVLPIAEFQGRGDEDYRKGQILNDLYQYSEDLDDYEKFMISILLEAITKGTAIGYEGQERKVQKIRNVKGTGDDISVTEGEKRTNRLYGVVVPLEDFYPSHVGQPDIKSMPYCFWRTVIPYQQFLMEFAMFANVDKVQPKTSYEGEIDDRPYYLDYISDDVQQGNVEIIRYYNRDTDEYVVIANGVWINPISLKDRQEISPLPFNHKELPFWDVRFELFNNFFYGRSLPDKLKSMQDVLNVLTNMLLDQSFLTIFPPTLIAGVDSMEDDYLRPGRRTPIDTQGMSLQESFMKLDMGVPTGWHQFILDYTRKVMEESSMDSVQSGVAGVGGRTTAQEIQTASAGVTAIIGLFGRLIKYGLKRKALLRGKNILQFWTDKNAPISQLMGTADNFNKAFNTFKIDNTVLTDGKRGTKVIEMYADKNKRPTKDQQKTRALLANTETNRNIEILSVTPDYLREFEFDVKLAINTKSEDTKEMQKALQLEKLRVYMSFFPDMVDKTELLAQTAQMLGDDPTKIIKPDILDQAMMTEDEMKQKETAAAGSQDNGLGTLPQGADTNAAMQKAIGKNHVTSDLSMLQGQMTG